jgi:hypothetical protein
MLGLNRPITLRRNPDPVSVREVVSGVTHELDADLMAAGPPMDMDPKKPAWMGASFGRGDREVGITYTTLSGQQRDRMLPVRPLSSFGPFQDILIGFDVEGSGRTRMRVARKVATRHAPAPIRTASPVPMPAPMMPTAPPRAATPPPFTPVQGPAVSAPVGEVLPRPEQITAKDRDGEDQAGLKMPDGRCGVLVNARRTTLAGMATEVLPCDRITIRLPPDGFAGKLPTLVDLDLDRHVATIEFHDPHGNRRRYQAKPDELEHLAIGRAAFVEAMDYTRPPIDLIPVIRIAAWKAPDELRPGGDAFPATRV